jgi:hypothetical protein
VYYRNRPPLSIAVQVAGLQRLFGLGAIKWDRSRLIWRGELSPSEFSRKYSVELIYMRNRPPEVYVREPNLTELAGGRTLPHVYDSETQELCLYLPGCCYWTTDKSLASTVMSWATLWLFYFELWLLTDVFCGRGQHPTSKQER